MRRVRVTSHFIRGGWQGRHAWLIIKKERFDSVTPNIAEKQLKGTLSSSPMWKRVVSVYRKIKLSVTLDDIRSLKSCLVFAYPS